MLGQLPETVKPFSLAENGQALEGELPLAKMPRLAEQLDSDSGMVGVAIQFGCDDQNIPFMKGTLKTELVVACQRCMESMQIPLEIDVSLALIQSPAEADSLPTHYEPLVIESSRLSLLTVVEDELMLALPIVAVHDTAECHAGETVPSAQQQDNGSNPFSVLAELKKDQTEKTG